MDRKDLLLEVKEKTPLDKKREEKVLTEGGALQNMLDTYGWRIAYDGFIKPNTEESRFLGAPREDLADIRAEIRILKQFLKFIETRIAEANKTAEKNLKGG